MRGAEAKHAQQSSGAKGEQKNAAERAPITALAIIADRRRCSLTVTGACASRGMSDLCCFGAALCGARPSCVLVFLTQDQRQTRRAAVGTCLADFEGAITRGRG